MHQPPDRLFEAGEILSVLVDHGVDFVVIGGIAVQTHGYLRGTHDLDIIVRPGQPNATRLTEALEKLDAEPYELDDTGRIPVMTRAGPVDVVNIDQVAGRPASYDVLRDAALMVDLRGRKVPVAGLSDLIRMKRATGRDHDLMDIEALTRDPEST